MANKAKTDFDDDQGGVATLDTPKPRFRVSIDDSGDSEVAKAARKDQPIAVIEAISEGDAERTYKTAFGIIGCEHPIKVEPVGANEPLTRLKPWTARELLAQDGQQPGPGQV